MHLLKKLKRVLDEKAKRCGELARHKQESEASQAESTALTLKFEAEKDALALQLADFTFRADCTLQETKQASKNDIILLKKKSDHLIYFLLHLLSNLKRENESLSSNVHLDLESQLSPVEKEQLAKEAKFKQEASSKAAR